MSYRLWPNTDSFSQGSPAFDTTQLLEWIRAVAWQTDASYALGGTHFGLQEANWLEEGRLYSGWFGQASGPGVQYPNPAAISAENAFGSSGPTAWLPRHYIAANVWAEFSTQLQSPSLSFIATHARRHFIGVGARLSGATLTNGGTSATLHIGGDGYWLCALFDPFISSTQGKWELVRVNAGATTRLADSPAGSGNFSSWETFAFHRTRRIKLEVLEEGGATRLRGWITPPGKLQPADGAPGYTLLFDYLDSSGSRITAAGRVGFFASGENISASVQAAPCINFFQAGPSGGLAALFEDWTRLNLGAAAALGSPPSFRPGFDLASGWAGDLWSASSVASWLRVDNGASRIAVDGLSGSRSGVFCRQREADEPWAQERKVTVRFSSAGAAVGARAAGPAVRVSQANPAAQPSSCYYLEYRLDDLGSTAELRLWRYSSSSAVLLASRATGIAYSQDADIVVALKVENAPDPQAGNVFLKAYVGGSQVQLEAPSGGLPLGIFIDSAGTVQDTTSARVLSGPGEGVSLLCPNTTARPIYFDTWDVGSGTGGAGDEGDQASRGWTSETAGAFGTLVLPLSFPLEERFSRLLHAHDLDLGDLSVRPAGLRERRSWGANWRMENADADALRAFYLEHIEEVSGRLLGFAWTPPGDSAALTAAFAPAGFSRQQIRAGSWQVSLELVELLA